MEYPWELDRYKNALNIYPKRVIDEATKNDILEEQSGQFVLIGHTLQWCNELENTCNEATALAEKYYNLGIEKGYIVPKKSTEDMLSEALSAIKYLADKVEKLESKQETPIITRSEVDNNGFNEHGNGDVNGNKSKGNSGSKK